MERIAEDPTSAFFFLKFVIGSSSSVVSCLVISNFPKIGFLLRLRPFVSLESMVNEKL